MPDLEEVIADYGIGVGGGVGLAVTDAAHDVVKLVPKVIVKNDSVTLADFERNEIGSLVTVKFLAALLAAHSRCFCFIGCI